MHIEGHAKISRSWLYLEVLIHDRCPMVRYDICQATREAALVARK